MKEKETASEAQVQEAAAIDALETSGRPSLTSGLDPDYAVERASFEAAADNLGLAVSGVAPPAGLKERLFEQINATRSNGSPPSLVQLRPGILLARTAGEPWQNFPHKGVRFKPAYEAADGRSQTLLVEMAPGSRYPDHHHDRVEELFVLEGSFSVSGNVLRAGDYCRSEAGTDDWDIFSEEGALFLVSLSSPTEPRPNAPPG